MATDYSKRRAAIRRELKQRKIDCLLVTHAPNWYYLTGFTGESGALVLSADGATLITDGRFTVQAKEETSGVEIELQKGGLYAAVGNFLKQARYEQVGFDPQHWTVAQMTVCGRRFAGAAERAKRRG